MDTKRILYLLLIVHHHLKVVDDCRLKVTHFLTFKEVKFLANISRYFIKVLLAFCYSLFPLKETNAANSTTKFKLCKHKC